MSRILVGCEFSGRVRDAFAALGHDAWSCDLLPTESKGYHLQCCVMEAVDFFEWDMIVLHPPCTAIALCGNASYGRGMRYHARRLESLEWTEKLWRLAVSVCPRVALENPKNVLGARIGKRTQSIHPWQFGHPEMKETWLWLHGLPPLTETHNVHAEMMLLPKCQRERIHYMAQSETRGKDRALTFNGIAKAMSQQWAARYQ